MNTRNVGIDFLKSIAMLFIITLHILGLGGIIFNLKPQTSTYNIVWFLELLAYFSVNTYAMITGYLMYERSFQYSKIGKLWLIVLFYSIGITFCFTLFFNYKQDIISWITYIFPVINNKYWYFTSYFCLYFFIPHINILISQLNLKQSKILVYSILFLFCFISNNEIDPFKINQGYSFVWIASMYVLGALLKKYNVPKKFNTLTSQKKIIGLLIMVILLTYVLKLLYEYFFLNILGVTKLDNQIISYNSIFIVCISVLVLIIFDNVNIKNKMFSKLICKASTVSFGVYLIHTHPIICKIYENKFMSWIHFNGLKICIYSVCLAVLIYIVCYFIDYIRQVLFTTINIETKFMNFLKVIQRIVIKNE